MKNKNEFTDATFSGKREFEVEHQAEEEPTVKTLIWILWIVIAILLLCGYGLKKHYEPQPLPKANILEIFAPVVTESDTIHLKRATTYWCTESQCDGNPYSTADGSIINPQNPQRWVALSRDLLYRWGGPFHYGDTIEIYSNKFPHLDGEYVVHDCMAAKYEMSIDFLMSPEKNSPKLGVGEDVKIIYCSENY